MAIPEDHLRRGSVWRLPFLFDAPTAGVSQVGGLGRRRPVEPPIVKRVVLFGPMHDGEIEVMVASSHNPRHGDTHDNAYTVMFDEADDGGWDTHTYIDCRNGWTLTLKELHGAQAEYLDRISRAKMLEVDYAHAVGTGMKTY